ncbi:MAG TPA: hypothetical protein VGD62_00760 [Acidobacteriaceae bacterium]
MPTPENPLYKGGTNKETDAGMGAPSSDAVPGPGEGLDIDAGEAGKAPGKDLNKVPNRDGLALHSVGEGYELTDVSVGGVGVFLVALSVTLVVFFLFSFGMGKVMNTVMRRSDGPASPWQQAGATSTGGMTGRSMQSNPAMEQRQLHEMTLAFPTPRLQADDGDQDLADMHAREDLLLGHYTYVDAAQGRVRIPIDRAMQLIAERGLPVAPQTSGSGQLMYGDMAQLVQVPLTTGFARTGYEQERGSPVALAGQQASARANNR